MRPQGSSFPRTRSSLVRGEGWYSAPLALASSAGPTRIIFGLGTTTQTETTKPKALCGVGGVERLASR
jgi:hypothetical protein